MTTTDSKHGVEPLPQRVQHSELTEERVQWYVSELALRVKVSCIMQRDTEANRGDCAHFVYGIVYS